MLTKFFSTTKPAAVIVVLMYMTLGFFYCNKSLFGASFNWTHTFEVIGMWLLFIVTMFILNFIVRKNDLTKGNTYSILIFGALSLSFPSAMQEFTILLAGVLVLMALRRVISLRSEIHTERKIFDASLWILVASLFYFYSFFYVLVIYFALVFYSIFRLRYAVIPFVALFCISVLTYAVLLFLAGAPQEVSVDIPSVSFNFEAYGNFQIILAISFLIGTLFWTIWKYLGEQNRASTVFKSRYSVVMGVLLVSFVLTLFVNDKSGAEWYFTLPAISIIVSNYVENTESVLFKESLLWLIVVLPVIVYLV